MFVPLEAYFLQVLVPFLITITCVKGNLTKYVDGDISYGLMLPNYFV